MASEDLLLNSLIDYVNDVKPYHTKLREFVSQLQFNDTFNVEVLEALFKEIDLQNIWTNTDRSSYTLSTIAEGLTSEKNFIIPATIFPRFSTNDMLQHGQTPHGNDPATTDLTDANANGIPDSEEPWPDTGHTGQFSYSHQLGSNSYTSELTLSGQLQTVTAASWSVDIITHLPKVNYTYTTTFTIAENPTYGWNTSSIRIFIDNVEYLGVPSRPGPVTAGSFVIGTTYCILSIGSTDFTLIGATSNTIGTLFVASGVGSGSGTAGNVITITGLTDTFTPTADDLAFLPASVSPTNDIFYAQYGDTKKQRRIRVYVTASGRYRMSYNQGSRVYVNNVLKTWNIDYIVGLNRDYIQFLAGKWPISTDSITINQMKADKLFISYHDPFNNSVDRGFDQFSFDNLLYDTDPSAAPTGDYFLITIDHSIPAPAIAATTSFFNTSIVATNKPALTMLSVSSYAAYTGDVWKVAAVDLWKFSVQQISPTVGPVQYANFKTVFNNGIISFIIDKSWTNYTITADPNSYLNQGLSAPPDPTEFQLNVSLMTEHGVITDPNPPFSAPIQNTFGKIFQQSDVNGLYYVFQLANTPNRGTYIELRIDQNDQYNQSVACHMVDRVRFTELIKFVEQFYSYAAYYSGQYGYAGTGGPPGAPIVTAVAGNHLPPVPSAPWLLNNSAYDVTSFDSSLYDANTYSIYDLVLFAPNNGVTAGNFVVGSSYTIISVGSTNFMLIGAAANTVGTIFTATGIGSGSGYAVLTPPLAAPTLYYSNVRDDFYLSVTYIAKPTWLGTQSEIIHNATLLPTANCYQEPGQTYSAGSFNIGTPYTIVSIGTTDFTLIGAASNTVGVSFTATGVGTGTGTASAGVNTLQLYHSSVTAGSFNIGSVYMILSVGTTNFTSIGAANNNIGTFFTASGIGTGTGTAGRMPTSISVYNTTGLIVPAEVLFDPAQIIIHLSYPDYPFVLINGF